MPPAISVGFLYLNLIWALKFVEKKQIAHTSASLDKALIKSLYVWSQKIAHAGLLIGIGWQKNWTRH